MTLDNDTRGWILASVSGIGDAVLRSWLHGLNYLQLVWWVRALYVSTWLCNEYQDIGTLKFRIAMLSCRHH